MTKAQQCQYIDDLATETARQKAIWLDNQMKRLLPLEIYNCAYADTPRKRMRVAKYMSEHRIQIEECPPADPAMKGSRGVTNLLKDGIIQSEFHVRLNGATVEVMSRDFPVI